MTDLFDEDHNLVEDALTVEEVEERLQEEKDKATEDATKQVEEIEEEHKQELKDLEEQLEQKKEEIEKEKEKEKNFTNLRGKTKEKDEAISKLTEKIEKLQGVVEEKMSNVDKGKVEDIVDSVVRNDKELKEKVLFHYNSFIGEPETKEKLIERVNNSYILATGSKPSNPLTGAAISSIGGSEVELKESKGKMSDREKEVAKVLGIEDDQLKKHGLI